MAPPTRSYGRRPDGSRTAPRRTSWKVRHLRCAGARACATGRRTRCRARPGPGSHGPCGRADADSTCTAALGCVHRDVGVLEGILGLAAGGLDRDADAQADSDLLAVDDHRSLQRGTDPLGDELGALRVGIGQQQGELVAAEARAGIPGPGQVPESVGDLYQHRVTAGVTARVVDGFEVIEIEEQHPATVDADVLKGASQGFVVGASVRQSGERIGSRCRVVHARSSAPSICFRYRFLLPRRG